MKKIPVILAVFIFIFASNFCFAGSKNVFKQLFKFYKDYEEINMLLWLTGDIGAEKRLGKELAFFQSLTTKKEGDKAKVDRVMRIFNRLAPQYNTHGMKLRCTVLHNKTVNAYAIPGGNIYVYSGIIDFLQSDDELAAVIAHELAHVERRHSLKNFRASVALTSLLEKALKNKKDKKIWSALVSAFALMSFSRKQEDEADDVGQGRLVAAGFNPYGQVHVWERFLKKYGDSSGLEKYLGSHPSHQSRIENAKRNIAKMNYKGADTLSVASSTAPVSNSVDKETVSTPKEKPVELPKPVNYIEDGSFEEGYNASGRLNNWEVAEGKFKLSDSVRLSGNYALEGVLEGYLKKGRILSNYIAVDKTSDLLFCACIKSENGDQVGSVGVELYNKNKRLRNRIWLKKNIAFPKEWNKIEGRLANSPDFPKIFDANVAYMRVVFQTGPGLSGKIWFDDVSVINRTNN